MKICTLIERLDPEYGGPSVSLPSLLNELSKDRYSVDNHVFSGYFDNKYSGKNDILNEKRINHYLFSFGGIKKIAYSRNLNYLLNKHAYDSDLFFCNNLWNYISYAGYSFSKKRNIPLVTSIRGALFPWSLSQGRYRKILAWNAFQKKMLQNSSLIHVTSEQEADAVKKLGIKSEILLSSHGVDIPDSNDYSSDASKIRLGLPTDRRYILFMSRLHSKKGLDLLLKVWKKISGIYKDWTLLIAGPDYGNYNKKINLEFADDQSIIMLGMLKGENKEDAFSASELFVLPSYTENFGVVIAEALARGIPVLTSNGTPWSHINDRQCGSCFDLSENNLGIELGRFLSIDRNKLKEYGLNGRNLIIENYSWSAKAKQFYEGISKVL
ncbi:glycosyltransferase [Acinetobacter venetianus]|uniref:glycosyltransferase n=1 Tax=Acinetobacter venetianus TaxID=52133 RepID=UPI003A8E4E10